jgi:hypothetical protein
MANKGWDNQAGGRTVSSNARTTMRTSGTEGAEAFIRGSTIAHPSGGDCDTLESRDDLFEPPGQLGVSQGCNN